MDLAVIDSFARADVPPRSGGRPSDDASESSFSDMLDTRMREREPEPVRERPVASETRADRRDADATRDARQPADTTKAAEPSAEPETDAPKSETVSAKPRVKPKSERDTTNGRDTAAESGTNESPATPAPVGKPATANGVIAAVVAELQNASTGEDAPAETPMGLLVAAVTPGATPQAVAASPVLSLLTDGTVAPPQPATTAPAAATPAAPAPAPAPTTATPAMPATPEFIPELKAATPEPLLVAATNTAPTAPQAQAPVMPDQVIAQAPATTAAVVAPAVAAALAKVDPAARAGDTAAIDAALEALAGETGEEVLPTVTVSNAAQPTASKPAPVLAAPSGYAAQLASQASTAETPAAAPTDVMKDVALDAANADKGFDFSDLTDAGENLAAVKPQETTTTHAASEPTTTRAASPVEAAHRAAARPVAVPIAEQVAVRISKAVSDGVDRISVKLNPAELGQIEIRMEIGPDGKFNAVFAADRPQTVELLQRDARELARSLQDAGLRTDTGSLSFNLRGQNQNQAQNGTGAAGSHPGLGNNAGDLTGDAAPLPTGLYGASNAANGRVDIRV